MSIVVSEFGATGPRLRPNAPRLVEAILFLIEEAERRKTYLTQYEVVKSLFVADTAHIESNGRPVTFDNYVAMEHGPVASEAYNMLKPGYNWHDRVGIPEAPWRRSFSPDDGKNVFKYSIKDRGANLRRLSATDVEALSSALTLVKALRFKGTRDFTHRHPAYSSAWRDDGGKVFDMDYRKIAADDPALADEISEVSRHI